MDFWPLRRQSQKSLSPPSCEEEEPVDLTERRRLEFYTKHELRQVIFTEKTVIEFVPKGLRRSHPLWSNAPKFRDYFTYLCARNSHHVRPPPRRNGPDLQGPLWALLRRFTELEPENRPSDPARSLRELGAHLLEALQPRRERANRVRKGLSPRRTDLNDHDLGISEKEDDAGAGGSPLDERTLHAFCR